MFAYEIFRADFDFKVHDTVLEFGAREGRHFATLIDLIEMRIADEKCGASWHRYYTTASSEFYGLYKGKPVVAVLHSHTSPLMTGEGLQQSFDDGDIYACVSNDVFEAIVEGRYGPAQIVDWQTCCDYRNSIQGGAYGRNLTESEIIKDPLFLARLGGEDRARRYLEAHRKVYEMAVPEQDERSLDSMVSQCGWSNHVRYCSYVPLDENLGFKGGLKIAPNLQPGETGISYGHLLVIEQCHLGKRLGSFGVSDLTFDISTCERGDAFRYLLLPEERCSDVLVFDHEGVQRFPEIATVPGEGHIRINPIIQIRHFDGVPRTEVEKEGDRMDSGKPEFDVTALEPIGEPVLVPLSGNLFFLRYDIGRDVLPVAPVGANAFERIAFDPYGANITVQFYDAKIDWSKRLMTTEEAVRSFEFLERYFAKAAGVFMCRKASEDQLVKAS